MRYHKDRIQTILLPAAQREAMIGHCLRKLRGDYLPDEGHDLKAFGLLGGKIIDTALTIEGIIPLYRNARDGGDKAFMDAAMNRHATPSLTPLDQRGWIAEPAELDSALGSLQAQGMRLVGNYHMHRVSWRHDPLRDKPTELDTVLGRASRMFMFIISMVRPEAPTIRAFFEGIQDLELPVVIV